MTKRTLLLLTTLALATVAHADVKKIWIGVDGIT
jgi:hypothetical protein